MTVIIANSKQMVADKLSYGHTINITTKIFKINGMMVGFAGRTLCIASALKWAQDGFQEEAIPESQKNIDTFCSIIVVNKEGEILIYENSPYPWKSERGIHAIGSGSETAMGAVTAGASLTKAVCIAIGGGGLCGMGIDVINIENDEVKTKIFDIPTFDEV